MSEHAAAGGLEEPKPDLGAMLKGRRMARGVSLEAAFQHTRIPKKFLEALEENHLDALPGPAYLRGFLRGYCEFLDLDFDRVWAQLHPATAPTGQGADPDRARPGATPAVETPAPGPGLPLIPESAFLPGALLAVLMLAGAAVWFLRKGAPSAPAPRPPSAPPTAIAPIAPPADVRIALVSSRGTWIQVRVDGTLRFEGLLPRQTRQEWRGKAEVLLRAAEPGELRVEAGGAAVDLDSVPRTPEGAYRFLPAPASTPPVPPRALEDPGPEAAPADP